jgi:hypothetical protein
MILPTRHAWGGRNGLARVGDELHRLLVQAHHRTLRVVWPLMDVQHSFSSGTGDKLGALFGRNSFSSGTVATA